MTIFGKSIMKYISEEEAQMKYNNLIDSNHIKYQLNYRVMS